MTPSLLSGPFAAWIFQLLDLKLQKSLPAQHAIITRQSITETTSRHRDNFKTLNLTWTTLISCLRQPGQLLNRPPKSMRVNINPLIKSCRTLTVPIAETKSIGLAANARGVMVFAISS